MEIEFTAEEWKALVKEHLTPIIEKELGMKQIGGTTWASDYHGGKRKVLSFFYITNNYATFQWGWNFEFVPKCPGTKVTWARTDKSVFTHIYEVPDDLHLKDANDPEQRKARERIAISRSSGEKDRELAWIKIVDHHKKALEFLLPTMKKFYAATETMEDCLKRIEAQLEHGYYRFINGSHLFLAKVFIEYYLGFKEKALADFDSMYFGDESVDLKNQFHKKLMALEK